MSSEYVLYIIMRSDMDSMNPGKACAQAAHAAHAFSHFMEHPGIPTVVLDRYIEWKSSTNQGFGTTITLAGSLEQIDSIAARSPYRMGYVRDPSYPIRDGSVTHHLSLITCAWVFDKKGCSAVRGLELMR